MFKLLAVALVIFHLIEIGICQSYCHPAQAFDVVIQLKEETPANGQGCNALDDVSGFYQLLPRAVLMNDVVIPTNCTINKLTRYSCRLENQHLNYNSQNRAIIDLKVIVLCNECQKIGSTNTEYNRIINQNELQQRIGFANMEFSIKVKERSGPGKKSHTKTRKIRSHATKKSKKSGKYFCNNKIFRHKPKKFTRCGE
jgi:hypothetical protein